MKAHTKILLGLVGGAALGGGAQMLFRDHPLLHRAIQYVAEPAGKMWLALLIMVVIPLIISTLAMGVAGLGDMKRLGRIGGLTLLCFLGLTFLSSSLGLGVMNLVQPGRGLDASIKTRLLETYKDGTAQMQERMGLSQESFDINLLVNMVPRNPVKAAANGDMLAVIVFALLVGVALARLPEEKATPMKAFLASLGEVTIGMIDLAMKAAPLGVFCLIFSVTARFGFDLMLNLLKYVATVLGAMLLFQILAYGLVLKFVAHRSPWDFLKKSEIVLITAFSTSSSNATLPTTIKTATDELRIPSQIAGFSLPLGATMNMNGTALYEGATVLFLAQVFGVDLSFQAQMVVILMSVVTAIGVAGIPGGSLPLLMMVLAMVKVPPEGIAIILGMDRILDMCRTVLNVSGDLVTAAVVDRWSGLELDPKDSK